MLISILPGHYETNILFNQLIIFQAFLLNFSNLYAKIKAENPFAAIFTGDFNAHSKYWWTDGDRTPEGSEIEHLLSSLVLSQVISEPTNFEPNKNPSCIDPVITDQPKFILDIFI